MEAGAERIILALDTADPAQAEAWVRQTAGAVGAYKVGMELFHAAGPGIFAQLRGAGADRLFYDGKFCDIPNTVAGVSRVAAGYGVWLFNVHALGGTAMMRAAREAAHSAAAGERPLVIAVTLLTSLSQDVVGHELGLLGSVAENVVRLAQLAQEAGLDGVVASPQEVEAIRAACGPDFLIVTPGVRPAGADVQDQKRVATPGQAIRSGADYLVLGRAITQAPDPRAAAESIAEEISNALG